MRSDFWFPLYERCRAYLASPNSFRLYFNDLLNTNDADTRYGKESETRSSETRPPHWPADPHNEEKAEQQKQPQCNHNQCETQDILIVTWERIDFAGRSFSHFLLVGCLIVVVSR